MKRYDVFHEDGRHEVIECKNRLRLKKLQGIVGGYIEIRPNAQGFVIMDEEGLLKGRKRNNEYPHLVGTVIQTTADGIK